MARHSLRTDTLYNVLTWGMTIFSQQMSPYFDSVNTGELPTSECNQWMRGILKVYEMSTKTKQKVLKASKVVTRNQPPILIYRDAKSLTSIIMILEVSNKHHSKLNKILRIFCFEHNL